MQDANPSHGEAGSLREAAAAIAAKSNQSATATPAQPAASSPAVEGGRMKVVSVENEPAPEGEQPEGEGDEGADPTTSRADPDDIESDFDEAVVDADDSDGIEGTALPKLPEERLNEAFDVKAAGKMSKVTLRELLRGHQQVSEAQSQSLAARQERQIIERAAAVYAQRLKAVEEVLAKAGGNERTPEQWQELYAANPLEYMRERDLARERQEQLRLTQQERQQVEQQQQALRQHQLSQHVQAEAQRLVSKFPKLADPKLADRFQTEVTTYLKRSLGASDQELSAILDHRLFVLAYKAMRYDNGKTMQKQVKAKAVETAPPVQQLPPGQPKATTNANMGPVRKAQDNLRRSGSIADAAALITARNKQRR